MTARVSPTERIRAEIDELIAGAERGSLLEHFEEVARAAVRLVFQTALENEVTEFFGRERYARGEREQEGSRNGYSPLTIKTTAGEVTLQRPKTRGTDVAFASRLLGTGVTRTTPWSPSSSPGSYAACRCATWRRASPTPSARSPRCRSRR